MQLPTHLKRNWFQLLTAAIVVGGMLQTPTAVLARKTIPLNNQASYTYSDSPDGQPMGGMSSQIVENVEPLIDPLGRITGCNGQILPDYTGFSVGIYEPDPSDPTGTEVKGLVPNGTKIR